MAKTPQTDAEATVKMQKDSPPGTEVGALGVPDFGDDFENYAGAGVSDRTEDFQIPFLAIAQSNSPQAKKQHEKYIPGCEEGDIFNTATGQFWKSDTGLLVIPVFFKKAMVEWIPRSRDGGYVATHPIDTPLLSECRMFEDENGKKSLRNKADNDMIDTSYHGVVIAETGEVAICGMASTNLGPSRTWQTLLKNIKVPSKGSLVVAPCFATVWRLRTVYTQEGKNSWYKYAVAHDGWSIPTYRMAYEEAKRNFVHIQEHGLVLGRPPAGAGVTDTSSVIDGDTHDYSDSPI